MDKIETEDLLQTLQARFEKHPQRHAGVDWSAVAARLSANRAALATVSAMEATAGEPDVVVFPSDPGTWWYVDCSAESPDRRSLCYDEAALAARKEHKPAGSIVGRAAELGLEVLDEALYRELQTLGEFDRKTQSWLLTPAPMRKLGGALFGDRRYDRVFAYHNGADSYYSSRGFRGRVKL